MSEPAPTPTANSPQFAEHLANQFLRPARRLTFDMDDSQELALLESAPTLRSALEFLRDEIEPRWQAADTAAQTHQLRHRRLAAIAIGSGVGAIAFAILQLTLKLTQPHWTQIAAWMEGVTVLAGVTAVCVGVWAKFDRKWICARHQAERFRILKFRALASVELWCGNAESWRNWVSKESTIIDDAGSMEDVEDWCETGLTEPALGSPTNCGHGATEISALTCYYQTKRLQFQSRFFREQGERFRKAIGRLHHLGLPIFFLSVGAVLIHFLAEIVAARLEHGGHALAVHRWEQVSILGVAAAALLPVLGLGIRAWLSAFELPRSASLYQAKHYALAQASACINEATLDLPSTLLHLANTEFFLENEHREWLRLIAEAEWFI